MPHPLHNRPVARRAGIVLVGLLATALVGCSAAAPDATSAESRTVDTVYGEIQVPEAAERVAAVSYDTPWQLMSLDITPVASIDYSRWLDSYNAEQQAFIADVPSIGAYGEPNFEAIAATEPDLIIGDAGEVDEATFERLSDIAPTVIVGGESRGDWQSITQQTADAVGRSTVWEESKATFEETLDRLRTEYADVISGNSWVHFSLGDDASQFSVQQPTGATGNLLVNELGAQYGAGVPTDYADNGYGSYPLEQLGTVFEGVTVALTFENPDGTRNAAIQAVEDNELFTRLAVAQSGHVYRLSTTVTDYVTAVDWLNEVEEKVLAVL